MTKLSANIKTEAGQSPAQEDSYSLLSHICENLTTVCHVFVVGLAFFFIYLATLETYQLFIWHPVCFSIGWVFFMTEAILMISRDNIFSAKISHQLRVRFHWLIQFLAISFCTAGFVIITLVKEEYGNPHYATWHGIFGLISVIFMGLCACNGLVALFNIELRKMIKPVLNKFIHATCGIIAYACGCVTLILSVYTYWFGRMTLESEVAKIVCTIMLVFVFIWTLVRPLLTSTKRFKTLIK